VNQAILPVKFKQRRLPVFLVAAALLHFSAVFWVPEEILVITQPLGDLSVSFIANGDKPGARASKHKQKWREDQIGKKLQPDQNYLALPRRDSHSSLASTDRESSHSVATRQTQTGSDVQSVRRQLLGAITSRLSKHLVYPPVARQRGWQGEVRLTVDINHTGELKNVQIASSSGHQLLDMSAKKALSDVRQIAMASNWQGRAYANMMIPVKYQLQDR
jgi:TonB family protein